jgi:WD40 repeat protein
MIITNDYLGGLENTALNAKFSAIAHDKEINNLSVSPNDKILASASQDKTVKVGFGLQTMELKILILPFLAVEY